VPLVWVATVALFSTPTDFDATGRVIWIAAMFLLLNAVFDPFLRANDTLYLVRAFATRPQWAKVITTAGFMTMVGVLPFAVLLPTFLESAGKDPAKWTETVLVVAIVMTLLGLTRFFFVKEKYGTADDGEPPIRLRDMATAIRGNRWIWLFALVPFMVAALTSANVVGYYWRYIVGDLSLSGVLSLFGVVTLPVLLVMPRLLRRFSVSQLIIGAAVLGVVGNVIGGFAWGSIPILVTGAVISSIAILPAAYISPLMILDLCAYNEWRGNRRLESTISAIGSIFSKVGAAFVAGATGVVLTVSGYDGSADRQAPAALWAINALAYWMPAILFVALIVAMLFYGRFDRRIMPAIRAELAGESPVD
jgi:probable glucitol transport protein GutA